DEEQVKNLLVDAGEAMEMSKSANDAPRVPVKRQIPLSTVADIRIVPGPSMIKSENGRLRSYVQLNVRGRDIVGFVEEARLAVAAQVPLPPGSSIDWSGQFEHQVRAQKTLTIVFPAVIAIIFV